MELNDLRYRKYPDVRRDGVSRILETRSQDQDVLIKTEYRRVDVVRLNRNIIKIKCDESEQSTRLIFILEEFKWKKNIDLSHRNRNGLSVKNGFGENSKLNAFLSELR